MGRNINVPKTWHSPSTWGHLDWVVLGVVIFVLVAIGGPFETPYQRSKMREVEVKMNLHEIQLCVERFGVDTEGDYPAYLIGGSVAVSSGTNSTKAYSSDELLRKGYITTYPANPFYRSKKPRSLELQANLPSSITGNDPLRPGDPEGDLLGYRFGEKGNLMGQVLCDPRYEKWSFTDPLSGSVVKRDTWAIIEYPFWDTWKGRKHGPEFLPGMFFYKSSGPIIAKGTLDGIDDLASLTAKYNEHATSSGSSVGSTLPFSLRSTEYIMGAYGSRTTPGRDIFGDEQPGATFFRWERGCMEFDVGDDYYISFDGPNWTRSAYSTTDLGGCPFNHLSLAEAENRYQHLPIGNPNGIPDGIMMVLTSGVDYH